MVKGGDGLSFIHITSLFSKYKVSSDNHMYTWIQCKGLDIRNEDKNTALGLFILISFSNSTSSFSSEETETQKGQVSVHCSIAVPHSSY